MKDKIGAREYVELSTLLQDEDQEIELQISSHSAKPTFTLVPKNKKEVNTISRWIKAFNCFTAVYSRRWPEEVPGLLKHMEVVIGLADDNANWRSYDRSFRKLQANGLESFGQINVDLYLSASKGPFGPPTADGGTRKTASLGREMCEGVSPPTLPDIASHSITERGAQVAHISTSATGVMRTTACPTAKSLGQTTVEKGQPEGCQKPP